MRYKLELVVLLKLVQSKRMVATIYNLIVMFVGGSSIVVLLHYSDGLYMLPLSYF
jgi:hypothetical protein